MCVCVVAPSTIQVGKVLFSTTKLSSKAIFPDPCRKKSQISSSSSSHSILRHKDPMALGANGAFQKSIKNRQGTILLLIIFGNGSSSSRKWDDKMASVKGGEEEVDIPLGRGGTMKEGRQRVANSCKGGSSVLRGGFEERAAEDQMAGAGAARVKERERETLM